MLIRAERRSSTFVTPEIFRCRNASSSVPTTTASGRADPETYTPPQPKVSPRARKFHVLVERPAPVDFLFLLVVLQKQPHVKRVQHLGDIHFDKAYTHGKALKLAEAIQLGLEK